MDSLYPVLSGALAQEKNLEIITNNLSNMNTTGFKKDFPMMAGLNPLGNEQSGKNGGKDPLPYFGFLEGVGTDFSPGTTQVTGEPLDVAIEGEGFFSVQTPEGVRYTRNGNFTLNSEAQIVTQDGSLVLGTTGPITLPPGKVIIDKEGRVSVMDQFGNAMEADTLQIVQFPNPGELRKTSGTLFESGTDNAVPLTVGKVAQGFLEKSNVNPVEEMVSMIRVMRLYESSQKVIQSSDEMSAKANNDLGKV